MDPNELKAGLEAILFVSNEPVKVEDLEDEHSIGRGTRVTVEFPIIYFH